MKYIFLFITCFALTNCGKSSSSNANGPVTIQSATCSSVPSCVASCNLEYPQCSGADSACAVNAQLLQMCLNTKVQIN